METIDNNIEPKKYYKIRKINSLNRDDDITYVFCGDNIKNKIDNGELDENLIDDLGLDKEDIDNDRVQFISTEIHPDDTINTLFNLINFHFNIPIPYQYLFINNYFYLNRGLITADSIENEKSLHYKNTDFIGCGHVIIDYVGHAFRTKKVSKGRVTAINSGDKLIYYQLNPFSVNVEMTRANSTPEEFNKNYKGNEYFVNESDEIIDGIVEEPTGDMLIDTVLGEKYGPDTLCLIDYRDYYKFLENVVPQPISNFLRDAHIKKYWPEIFKNDEYIEKYYTNIADNETTENTENTINFLYNQHNFLESAGTELFNFEDDFDDVENLKTKFSTTGITEIIVHINYDTITDDFIDLYKIWDRIKLDDIVPFIKIKNSEDADVLYHIYDNVKNYVKLKTIYEWVSKDPKDSKDLANASVHGVSFKLQAYKIIQNDENEFAINSNIYKYATVNIYKNGRIELKCSWDEKFNDGKGADLSHVRSIIDKLSNVIDKINKISYQIDYKRKQLIEKPNTGIDGNTQIILMNTLTKFTIGEEINYTALNKFGQYFGYYVNVIKTISGNDDPNTPQENSFLQLRYKRVDGFTNMPKITRFIHSIFRESPEISEEVVVSYLKPHFNLTPELATDLVRDYKIKYGDGSDIDRKKEIKKGRKRQLIFNDFVTIQLVKQPGVDITIRGTNPSEYRILINGVKNPLQLTQIIKFIKSFIIIFKYQNNHDIESNLKNLGVNEIEDDDKNKKNLVNVLYQEQPINVFNEDVSEGMFRRKPIGKQIIVASDSTDESSDESDENDIISQSSVDSEKSELSIDEESEEEEEEAEPTIIPKNKSKGSIKTYDPTDPPKPLDRLKLADPILFAEKPDDKKPYPRDCQATERQPMVISLQMYQEKMEEATDSIKKLENLIQSNVSNTSGKSIAELQKELTQWKNKVDIYKNGIEYRDNFYFCANGYNYRDEEILDPEEIAQYHKGNISDIPKHLFIRKPTPPGKNNKARFLENCAICCFSKDDHGGRKDKCLGAESGKVKKETTHSKTLHSVTYILGHKSTLTAGRYGKIPPPLYYIFNTTDDILNAQKIEGNFSGYLRRGAGNFLSAILEIVTYNNPHIKTVQDLINEITSPVLLPISKFQSLKQGTLKTIFQESENDTDEDILEKFKIFINTEPNKVTEDFIWDYITSRNVITTSGFNLFIFEQHIDPIMSSKDKKKFNFKLKCPIGFEMSEIYQQKRPSVVLIKYPNNTYNVICKVEVIGLGIDADRFIDYNDNIMTILNSMLNNCKEQVNDYYHNHAMGQLLHKADTRLLYKNPKNFSPPIGLKPVIKAIKSKYPIKFQIIDKYNKIIRLVLNNGVIIPVKPSGRDQTIDIWEENYFNEHKDNELAPCSVVYQTLNEISELYGNSNSNSNSPSNSNLKPLYVQVYPSSTHDDSLIEKENLYVGFVLQNGLTSEFKAISHDEYLQEMSSIGANLLQEDYRYYQDTYNVDSSIERSNWKMSGPDARTYYVNNRMFEDETYQRLRFELSKFLHEDDNQKIRQDLINTINIPKNEIPINDKRQRLYNIVKTLVETVSTDYRPPELELRLDNYNQPNIRRYCREIEADDIIADPHCTINEDGMPKLYIREYNLIEPQKNNVNKYTALVVEELLKNSFKRKEILDDIIDTTVRGDVIEHQDGVTIVKNAKAKPVRAEIDKIYNPVNTYETKLLKSYDMISGVKNTVAVSDMDECQNTWDKVPVLWRTYIGGNLHVLVHNNTTMCIYKGLLNAIIQLPDYTYETIDSIKSKVADFIVNLEPELHQNGKSVSLNPSDDVVLSTRKPWQVFYDYIKYTFTGNKFASINDDKNFIKYATSPSYQLTVADIMIISHIYNVKIIILKKLRLDKNEKLINLINMFPSSTTTPDCDNYMLMLHVNYENYRMIADTEYSPHKYIFNKIDIPKKLVELIDIKLHQSEDDDNMSFEDKLYSLLNTVSPVTKDFNVVDKIDEEIIYTGVERKVNPQTTDILAVQSLNPHLTRDQKSVASQYINTISSSNPLMPIPVTISEQINLETNTHVPSNQRLLSSTNSVPLKLKKRPIKAVVTNPSTPPQ